MDARSGDGRAIHWVDQDHDASAREGHRLETADPRFAVETATDGAEVLERLRAAALDAVVTEYDLPGMTGLELHQRAERSHGDVPFLLFTESGCEAIASEAFSAGVEDYGLKDDGEVGPVSSSPASPRRARCHRGRGGRT